MPACAPPHPAHASHIPAPHRLASQAERILQETSQLRGRPVQCRYDAGTLVLRGCVDSFYMKQIAQTVLNGMHGIDRIRNELVVRTR